MREERHGAIETAMCDRRSGDAGEAASFDRALEEGELEPRAVEAERKSLQERIRDWLDLPMAILALVWTALFVVELVVPLPPETSRRVLQADLAIWGVFAVEFLVEFALAPNKSEYLRANVLVALSVALPFVRAVRIVRLARVLRSISLVRVVLIANRATVALGDLLRESRFAYLVAFVAVTVLLGAASVYFFERGEVGTPFSTFWEALWWSAGLITTVDVGFEPRTVEGRVVALLLRVVGVAVFGYITASVASFLVGRRALREEERERERERAALQRLADEVQALRQLVARSTLTEPAEGSAERRERSRPSG